MKAAARHALTMVTKNLMRQNEQTQQYENDFVAKIFLPRKCSTRREVVVDVYKLRLHLAGSKTHVG